ncbi:MAG: DUF262 domain-containing protein [Nitrospirae bacterium]|nr:DUF262 domain-containing protein [Nitrospirota bacterium]
MKTWQINKTTFKVSDFLSWQKAGNLDLTPPFQRRSVWKKGAKSYLIDTIIRGLPIPIIFIRDKQSDEFSLEPLREVVDGQQRLRTLISFIAPKYLKDYKSEKDDFKISRSHNKDLANKVFEDLDKDTKQIILDYQFSVHVLPADISDRDILQIFARMNSTGTKLNRQELRNAGWFGEFKMSVYESAFKYFDAWRKWKVFTDDNISRMDEVELSTEFYSLMIKGITGKSQNALDKLYDDYDEEGTFKVKNVIEKRFEIIMDTIDETLGEFIAQSPFKKKTIFYMLFATIYDICYGINSELVTQTHNKVTVHQINILRHIGEDLDQGSADTKIMEAATRRTTNPLERKILFKYFKTRIDG